MSAHSLAFHAPILSQIKMNINNITWWVFISKMLTSKYPVLALEIINFPPLIKQTKHETAYCIKRRTQFSFEIFENKLVGVNFQRWKK